MMQFMADAFVKVEELIATVSAGMPESAKPKMRTDPDDPWASTINVPNAVYKERCAVTGYLLTRPFEKQCPMPAVFVKDNSYLDGMLKPVLRPVGDAGAAAEQAAPAAGKQGVAAPVPAAADGKSEGGKGKKEKKEKAPKAAAAAEGDADPKLEAFGKAQLQVGQVTEVGFVENSDKLYLCQVLVAADDVRQVVTGLRKHVPIEDLLNKKVVVITNLKAAKLAGQNSEAMIMATEADGVVKLLVAPQEAAVGERLYLSGGAPTDGCPKTLKTHFWETCKAHLKVVGGKGTFDGKELVVATGPITAAAGIPDGAEIK